MLLQKCTFYIFYKFTVEDLSYLLHLNVAFHKLVGVSRLYSQVVTLGQMQHSTHPHTQKSLCVQCSHLEPSMIDYQTNPDIMGTHVTLIMSVTLKCSNYPVPYSEVYSSPH